MNARGWRIVALFRTVLKKSTVKVSATFNSVNENGVLLPGTFPLVFARAGVVFSK